MTTDRYLDELDDDRRDRTERHRSTPPPRPPVARPQPRRRPTTPTHDPRGVFIPGTGNLAATIQGTNR